MSEQDSYSVTLSRVHQVFGTDLHTLSMQEANILNSLLDKAIKRNGDKPVPLAEIEGCKEMLGHLWPAEFNGLSTRS